MKHRWSTPIRTVYRSERTCLKCGLVRITRHDDPYGYPWTEWRLAGKRLYPSSGTPECQAAEVAA